jgi:hypothetical protein
MCHRYLGTDEGSKHWLQAIGGYGAHNMFPTAAASNGHRDAAALRLTRNCQHRLHRPDHIDLTEVPIALESDEGCLIYVGTLQLCMCTMVNRTTTANPPHDL